MLQNELVSKHEQIKQKLDSLAITDISQIKEITEQDKITHHLIDNFEGITKYMKEKYLQKVKVSYDQVSEKLGQSLRECLESIHLQQSEDEIKHVENLITQKSNLSG